MWTLGHKCTSNQTFHCKIIEGQEVQVPDEEDTYDSDTNSHKLSIETITCIQQPKHNKLPKRGPGTSPVQGSKERVHQI